jgi:hypothetical protein
MCLFLPASEWPPLGGMEKIPHFYKVLLKGVFLFDTLIRSKFLFFLNFWSFFIYSRTLQVKGHIV